MTYRYADLENNKKVTSTTDLDKRMRIYAISRAHILSRRTNKQIINISNFLKTYFILVSIHAFRIIKAIYKAIIFHSA